jgi:diadenosine tetraphosphate (Ap4A) HIT family hydrolase
VVAEYECCYAGRVRFVGTLFHTLIISKRYLPSYFNLCPSEITTIHRMLDIMKKKNEELDDSVSGFKIGVKVGEDAGQFIFYVHIHLISRRKGY